MTFLYYFTVAWLGFIVAELVRLEWCHKHEHPYAICLAPLVTGLWFCPPTIGTVVLLGGILAAAGALVIREIGSHQ